MVFSLDVNVNNISMFSVCTIMFLTHYRLLIVHLLFMIKCIAERFLLINRHQQTRVKTAGVRNDLFILDSLLLWKVIRPAPATCARPTMTAIRSLRTTVSSHTFTRSTLDDRFGFNDKDSRWKRTNSPNTNRPRSSCTIFLDRFLWNVRTMFVFNPSADGSVRNDHPEQRFSHHAGPTIKIFQ